MIAPEALAWLTFQLQLLDYLADAWRWWAVMGAVLALLGFAAWVELP